MTIQVTSHQRLGPGQTRVINDLIGVNIQSGPDPLTSWNFNNAGTIIVDVSMPYIVVGMNYDFGSFHHEAVFTNEATGIFQVISRTGMNPTFGLAGGHFGSGWNGDLVNAGLFEVTAVGYAAGAHVYDGTFSLQNSGAIRVTSQMDHAVGAWAVNGGIYANTGTIAVQGLRGYGLVLEKHGSITNSGSIRVTATGLEAGVGVVVRSFEPEVIRIQNTGLIEADIAILDQSFLYTPIQDARQEVFNGGTIRGRVDLKYGDDELVNAGLIDGRVDLGAGADVYDGTLGETTDQVSGGAGADRLIGGNKRDVLIGDDGDDDLSGGGGDDILAGGRGADRIDGGDGLDTVVFGDLSLGVDLDLQAGIMIGTVAGTITGVENAIGSAWADNLRGDDVANRLFGADGDDILEGRGGDDVLCGEGGADRLTGGDGSDTFVFVAGGGHDVITDFQPGVDRLQIHGHPSWREMRQDGADVLLILSDTDSIRLTGLTVAGLGTSSLSFLSTPAPRIDAPNLGGTVNRADALIVKADEATVAGEVLVFRGPSTAVIVGTVFVGPGVRFVNEGRIDLEGNPEAAPLVGVYTTGSDSGVAIINGLAGHLQVHGAGPTVAAYGVLGGSIDARVENYGTIDVSAEDDAYGITRATWSLSSVVNAGILLVESGARAVGISAGQWGRVSNSGLIEVSGSESATGIDTTTYTPTVVNSGTIRVESADGEAIGINGAFGQLLVDNSGTIEAAIAIRSNFYDDRIDNTGHIIGTVSLGNGADVLANHGRITGVVNLGDGADRYEGALSGFTAIVNGEAGDDQLIGGRAGDTLKGGAGTDLIDGGQGGDTLDGGAGDDKVYGGEGNDILYGGEGQDVLDGGAGDDILIGNAGNDIVIGGTGTDTLLVTGESMHYRVLFDGDDFILKGRDGSDHLSGVEFIRFGGGEVWDLARLYADGREVLPGATTSKAGENEPLVLPGRDDEPDQTLLPGLEADVRPGLALRLDATAGDFHPDSGWAVTAHHHPDWS